MKRMAPENFPADKQSVSLSAHLYYFAGCRYWTASILPALAGTTLPFWLQSSGFTFKWIAAIEFLIAVVFFHAGFSFLLGSVKNDNMTSSWPKTRLIKYACICIVCGCLLGLDLNSNLILRPGVPKYIFIVYGLTTLFVGVLYVLPPFNFYKRIGGEIIIAEGLGMIPVLGAYLIQVGDLTRTVYLGSLPLVVATGLWVWMDELVTGINDEKTGRRTLVNDFGVRFSGRYGVAALSFVFILTILVSVFSGSVNPALLIALLLLGPLWKIVTISWKTYTEPEQMAKIRRAASVLHFAIGIILTVTSLVTLYTGKG